MAKAIAGFFRTRADGEAAQEALLARGFSRDEVSFVAGDTREHEMPKIGPIKETGADAEAPRDAYLGSAIGLVAGMIAVFIPGIGPLIAAGPIAGAIGGLAVGAGVGGVIGLLKDHGVSDEEAEFYAEGVRRGGAVVSVNGISEDREKTATEVLEKRGAIHVEELASDLRAAGWSPTGSKRVRRA